MRRRIAIALAIVLVGSMAGCSNSPDQPASSDEKLRVGSFDFVESEILAEVYAQAAEAVGIPVTRLGAIGPREIVVPAMRNDLIDLVPEYVGSALRFLDERESPDDVERAVDLLNTHVDRYGIDVLSPSSAVDSNVFVVSIDTSERLDLDSVSDLAGAGLTRFGGPPECPERPHCLAGIRDTYGVSFDEFVAQPSLAFTAEALRRAEIDVGVMFSTSPQLDAPDLVELVDDKNLQPPENVVPMVRRTALERWGPDLKSALDAVSDRLTTAALRRLNGLVADGTAVDEVARSWLASL